MNQFKETIFVRGEYFRIRSETADEKTTTLFLQNKEASG